MTKYRWISARKAVGFPIRLCCRVAEVPPSSYYDWRETHGAGPTASELDEAYLVNAIMAIHDTLDDTYGSPRLTCEHATTRPRPTESLNGSTSRSSTSSSTGTRSPTARTSSSTSPSSSMSTTGSDHTSPWSFEGHSSGITRIPSRT